EMSKYTAALLRQHQITPVDTEGMAPGARLIAFAKTSDGQRAYVNIDEDLVIQLAYVPSEKSFYRRGENDGPLTVAKDISIEEFKKGTVGYGTVSYTVAAGTAFDGEQKFLQALGIGIAGVRGARVEVTFSGGEKGIGVLDTEG